MKRPVHHKHEQDHCCHEHNEPGHGPHKGCCGKHHARHGHGTCNHDASQTHLHSTHGHHAEHDHGHPHDHTHGHKHEHSHAGHHHHGTRERKNGILLAIFGSTIPEARAGYDELEHKVEERFPGISICRAYTADKVRRKMRRAGEQALAVGQALADMYDNGFTHVAVQSLHTIAGVEYEWTKQQAAAMQHPRKGLHQVAVGLPLLSGDGVLRASAAVPTYLPTGIAKEDVAVLVGHGSYHSGQVYYQALQGELAATAPRVLVGALMGPGLGMDDVMRKLSLMQAKTVHLIPFMCVPGHHFMLDMAGDHAESWSCVLRAHGFDCLCHKQGTSAHKPFADIWLDHLETALTELGVRG